jgi:2-C-methyl-D-erythritol 4-phosphate cytidylyltransferase
MASAESHPGGAGPPAGAAARDFAVILAAAGSGVRYGGEKALEMLAGRPLVLHCLRLFASLEDVREIVIAARRERVRELTALLSEWTGEVAEAAAGRDPPRVRAVEGGGSRQESVAQALAALSPSTRGVLVHDAARPLVRAEDVRKVIGAVRQHGAAVLGHPSSDSVKLAEEEAKEVVSRDLPRERVWLVQTPQGAAVNLLRRAHEAAKRTGLEGTDEAGLLSALGVPVRLVEGSRRNVKITYPEDLALAEFFLGRQSMGQ